MSRALTPEEKKLVRDHMAKLGREARAWVENEDRRVSEEQQPDRPPPRRLRPPQTNAPQATHGAATAQRKVKQDDY